MRPTDDRIPPRKNAPVILEMFVDLLGPGRAFAAERIRWAGNCVLADYLLLSDFRFLITDFLRYGEQFLIFPNGLNPENLP